MVWVITIFLSVLVFMGLFALFLRIHTPVYRLEKDNLICLFDLVLQGKATEDDWNVFIEMPIRHDPVLEAIRASCIDLTGEEVVFSSGGIKLTDSARQELQQLLEDLKAAASE